MSRRLWDLDWAAELPWEVDGISVEVGSLAPAVDFMGTYFDTLFAGQTFRERFLADPMTPAKRRWGSDMDFFVLRDGPRVVGVLMGHPSDWSTYYLRNTAILPDFRGRRLIPSVIGKIAHTLHRLGVERMQGDVSPTNVPSLRMLLSQGFFVTSTLISERWGACVQLTKFLHPGAREVFERQFCAVSLGAAPQPFAATTTERSTP